MKQTTFMWIVAAALSFSATALAGNIAKPLVKQAIDGELVYKTNCTRCHKTIRTYSARSMRTMVMHMRVRANLTKPEAEAIFHYLAGDQVVDQTTAAGSISKRGDE